MKSRELLQVAVEVMAGWEETVSAILEDLFGTSAVSYHNLETGRIQVSVFPPATPKHQVAGRAKLVRRLAALDGTGSGKVTKRISIRRLKPRDWAESWKRHFKPIEIPGQLLIRPSWSRRKPKAGEKLVILDPGLSFGTGQHPTTRFCLEQLAASRLKARRQSFLDIGTGTGILAIAAAKLGYDPVQAFDFDPASIRIARENARENSIRSLHLARQDLTRIPVRSREKFDTICANLTYDLLIAERRRIVGRLKQDGCLILAGILNSQFAEVEAAFRDAGLIRMAKRTEHEWTSAAFRFDGDRAGD